MKYTSEIHWEESPTGDYLKAIQYGEDSFGLPIMVVWDCPLEEANLTMSDIDWQRDDVTIKNVITIYEDQHGTIPSVEDLTALEIPITEEEYDEYLSRRGA